MMKKCLTLLILITFVSLPVLAQEGKYIPEKDPVAAEKIKNWQDLKLGLLMHWGAYSQWGIVESWSICSEDEGWCCRKGDPPYDEYKRRYFALKKSFNPVKFDPARWAEAARKAGMKYFIFTTKHHDGFTMYDTALSDYKVTAADCPFSKSQKADITKELFSAFRKEGLWVGAYYSKPDWHSQYFWWDRFATPDRFANYDLTKYPERWEKFVEFTQGQLDELVSNYGKVDILWLDGGWVRYRSPAEIRESVNQQNYKGLRYQNHDIRMQEIVDNARNKQPGIIVVDRAVEGPHQNYLTPEARVPEEPLPYPWETCMPMATSWSYVPNDNYKSAHELILMLVDVVSKGGNLLLNIGPGPDGTLHEAAYDRLEEIGAWMAVNSESIYAAKAVAPYKVGNICLTEKSGNLYAFYMAESDEKMPGQIFLPQLPREPKEISMLGVAGKLEWKKYGHGYLVEIPAGVVASPPCKYVWVLKIC